jgi:hypothetical protein
LGLLALCVSGVVIIFQNLELDEARENGERPDHQDQDENTRPLPGNLSFRIARHKPPPSGIQVYCFNLAS